MNPEQPSPLTVREVFARGRYVVPIYQRAYAWGDDQILTLLRDVRDYHERAAHSYYIGSLVTHSNRGADRDREIYEVVDGQQRLTTLFIVLATLGDMGGSLAEVLTFEGRARSSADLALLARHGQNCSVEDLQEFGIKVGVKTVRAAHERGEFTDQDLDYLLEKVQIVRTTLPARTDLNHYFEVMNSRGEQLEKHEIVKAALMGTLSDDPEASRAFARIWDACSDMSRHVQARFDSAARSELFNEGWDEFNCSSFDDIVAGLRVQSTGETHRVTTLSAILGRGRAPDSTPATDDSDATERYGAIIDFPNFLLHVLALSVDGRTPFAWSGQTPVPLDDKQLVEAFKDRLTTRDNVQNFGFNLLRARYLFDRYVIKTDRSRESQDDSNWVLRRARKRKGDSGVKLSPISTFASGDADGESTASEENEHVVMLQSMFQVTDSRRSYKNFLYAILEFLFDSDTPVTATQLVDFLRKLADDRRRHNVPADGLDTGTSVPHFAFNYLDYLLWRGLIERRLPYTCVAYTAYRFRYRTSVEHFYPQHPDPESQIPQLDAHIVDRFGNLCLMSRSDNSKRSNLAPAAKISQYRWDRQSLKFQVMAAITRAGTWEESEIEAHGARMTVHLNGGINTLGT